MDVASAADITEGAAENRPLNGDSMDSGRTASSLENSAVGSGFFCCHDCDESFKEETLYLEHRHQHQRGSDFSDDQPGGLNDSEMDNRAANFCTLCSISFVGQRELRWHIEKDHGQTSQQESKHDKNPVITKQQPFECPECGKCYAVFGHLLNHQRSHQQATKSLFKDLDQLKKKAFQCESCGRSYSRASALDAHRRCHEENLVKPRYKSSGEAPNPEDSEPEPKTTENEINVSPEQLFTCACGKKFTAQMRLKTHQRFSRNSQCNPETLTEKPKKSDVYTCSECRKTFHGHIAYYNHQRWHDNHSDDTAKRFACEECGKTFISLAFYDRHQRIAHSDEAPSKSFLHQVCQIQKKSFECADCGLKFSRASALQSHQLHHTDVFRETEHKLQMGISPIPQQNFVGTIKTEKKTTEKKMVFSSTSVPENLHDNDTDEDVASYEPGDFNVHVISASESEEEASQDLNPDLELLCESDQDDGDPLYAPYVNQVRLACKDCGLKFTNPEVFKTHLHQHALEDEEEGGKVEEKQGQSSIGNIRDSAAEVDEDREEMHRNVNGDRSPEEVDVRNSSSHQHLDNTSIKPQSFYSCAICGKVYIYLVSFRKHIRSHSVPQALPKKLKLKNYKCFQCGRLFRSRERLLSHRRVHKSQHEPRKCDLCSKSFGSLNLWIAHNYFHQQKPFWCLSCAKGFMTDMALDKHLLRHSQMSHVCTVCQKSFPSLCHLKLHSKSHAEAKAHTCKICGKSFPFLGNLISHRKKQRSGFKGFKACQPGIWNSELSIRKKGVQKVKASSVGAESDVCTDKGKSCAEGEHQSGSVPCWEDSKERANSEESDCGEPMHSLRPRQPPGSDGAVPPGDSNSVSGEQQRQGARMHREHKYWEWECCECDMGFDEMAQLHLHYIQHATGEIPIPADVIPQDE